MTHQPKDPAAEPPGATSWRKPNEIALAILWIVAAGAVAGLLAQGTRHTDQYQRFRYILQATYVAVLLWFLVRTGPSMQRLPQISPLMLRRRSIGRWIPVMIVALLFAMTILFRDGVNNLYLLLMVATIWILITQRRRIRLRMLVQGLALATVAFLGGLPLLQNGFIWEKAYYIFPGMVAPMYVAGALVVDRTGAGRIRLFEKGVGPAFRSFVRGCLLFLPLGLINAAEGSPGSGIAWVSEWWMPVTVPLFSGIVEEVWWRLLVIPLCYLLLRPAFPRHQAVALIAAVLFSGIPFGLGHGWTMERFHTTSLMYGLPMAAVFARRDFEHAVGAHYMVNFIPWLMVFLET